MAILPVNEISFKNRSVSFGQDKNHRENLPVVSEPSISQTMKSLPIVVLFTLNPSLMEAKLPEMQLPKEIKTELVTSPQQNDAPFGWKCFKYNLAIRYSAPAKGNGADYHVIYSSFNKEKPKSVDYVYLLKDGANPSKESYDNPPMVVSLIYHDLGEGKEFLGAVVLESIFDKNGNRKGRMRREIRLDDNTAQGLINLISGRSKWDNETSIKFQETKSEKLRPVEDL